uniref:Urea active transporter 3.2 n=1 Tax=Bangia sp. ESS1 TaxID=2651159 RepID=A0A7S7YGT8_9RHOD|nr:urea active transporter 3.2 [Bangia sp. ESS1]
MATLTQANPSIAAFECTNAANVVRNYFSDPQYECAESFFGGVPVLDKWVGYVIVLAFGISFGIATVGLVLIEQHVLGRKMDSEFFNTAGRSVKTGLTASVIVSQWTWAATLLQSSNVAYKYGVSGPFWYASGATLQIIVFSLLAVQVKRRAPTAHTFLEIIQARWGTLAHSVFLFFALATNIIVTSMLILGGSAVVNALTGINTDLASFLIPLGVILYTLAGGLKATFVASYFNTAVILIALCIFVFQVYVTDSTLGSPSTVYDRLARAVEIEPVVDNRGGSYLTLFSKNGLLFGLSNICGNFGTVFVDQSYWQSAIAATPQAAWKGYILGGLSWFSIPFTLATSLGLASLALSLPVTADEAGSGLVPPAVATHLMGKGGSVLILVMLFMAVTSTGAAEQIAVSSLVAYDVYAPIMRRAGKPVSGKSVVFVSRIAIVAFGLLSGVLGIGLNAIGLNLGWVYLGMGVIIGSAVAPVAMAISWAKCSGAGAVAGAVGGLCLAIASWLGYASTFPGGVNIDNTGKDEVMVVGNLVAILSSAVICIIVSLIRPDTCDWTSTKSIPLLDADPAAELSAEDEAAIDRAMRMITLWGIGLALVLVVAWPLLALPAGVFSKSYFTFWVILSIIWGLLATGAMVLLPVWESRTSILGVLTCGKVAPPVEAKSLEDPVGDVDRESSGSQE